MTQELSQLLRQASKECPRCPRRARKPFQTPGGHTITGCTGPKWAGGRLERARIQYSIQERILEAQERGIPPLKGVAKLIDVNTAMLSRYRLSKKGDRRYSPMTACHEIRYLRLTIRQGALQQTLRYLQRRGILGGGGREKILLEAPQRGAIL